MWLISPTGISHRDLNPSLAASRQAPRNTPHEHPRNTCGANGGTDAVIDLTCRYNSHAGTAMVPVWDCFVPLMGLIFAAEILSVCDNGRLSFDNARVLKKIRHFLRDLPFVSGKVPV